LARIVLESEDIVALTAVGEARRLSAQVELWPGWSFAATPVLLCRPGWRMLLVGHPDPPPGFEECDFLAGGKAPDGLVLARFSRVPWIGGASGALELERGGAIDLMRHMTAVVPYPAADCPVPGRVARLAAAACGAAFAAHLARRIGHPPLGPLPGYAALEPVNNALGALEGLILHDALWGEAGAAGAGEAGAAGAGEAGAAGAGEAARALVLVRRERRQNMDEVVIAREQRTELLSGLGAYVAARAAQAIQADAGGTWGASARAAAGDALAEWRGALRAVNRRGRGAAGGRFRLTGMACAFLLDRLGRSSWHDEASAGEALDALLERGVRLDGGSGDNSVVARTECRYGYLDLLDEETAYVRQEQDRRRGELRDLLGGWVEAGDGDRGQKIVFDVSRLELRGMAWLEAGHRPVNANVAVYHGPVTFDFGCALLSFNGLPVAEDRKTGLLHVNFPGQAITMSGDGGPFSIDRGAEFTTGLEVDLPGLYVAATRGALFDVDGELMVRLRRPPAVWRRRPAAKQAAAAGAAPGEAAPAGATPGEDAAGDDADGRSGSREGAP